MAGTSLAGWKKRHRATGGERRPALPVVYVLIHTVAEREQFAASPTTAKVSPALVASSPLTLEQWLTATSQAGGMLKVVRRGIYDKQLQFHQIAAHMRGFCAGRGSGKSEVAADYILGHARDGDPWLAVSPDANVVMSTTWPIFERLSKERGSWVYGVKSPIPKITFRTRDGGQAEIVFKSAERPDKLVGSSNAGLWFDEPSVISRMAFDRAHPCLRHLGRFGPCLMTFTPRGRAHWTFETFYQEADAHEVAALETGDGEDLDLLGDLSIYEQISGRWYRQRDNTQLIRAASSENPFLPAEYVAETGSHLSAALRAQELAGEFIDALGLLFDRDWFMPLAEEDEIPLVGQRVRYWDRASSTGASACYTAGVLMVRDQQGIFWVEDVVRGKWTYEARNAKIRETAVRDSRQYANTVYIYGEQEPGSSGKEVSQQFIKMLAGYPVFRDVVSGRGTKLIGGIELPHKAKIVRAQGFIAQAEARHVRVKKAHWTSDFLDELLQFPLSDLCDQCVASGTLIATARGDVPVERMQGSDFVWTRQGLFPILRVWCTSKDAETRRLTLDDGRAIDATSRHPFWCEGEGWRCLDDLDTGKVLLTSASSAESSFSPQVGDGAFALSRACVISIGPSGEQPVWNLTVDGPPEYFANGILVHNCDAASGALNKLSKMWTIDPGATERIERQPDPSRFGVRLDRSAQSQDRNRRE